MIGLSNSVKDEMLGAFASRQFTVALYAGDAELADAISQRREFWCAPPEGAGEVRYVENTETVLFEGFNSRHLIDHWGIVDAKGDVRARYRISDPI